MTQNSIIYLDYNATTPIAKEVLDCMLPYFTENFGNASSNHLLGWQAKEAVDIAKEQIAFLINCHPSEIYFTSGASESIQWVLQGVQYNELFTSRLEHKASANIVENYLQNKKITHLKNNNKGEIDFSDLKINPASLCSIILANNEIGNINEIYKLKAITKGLIHTDASQAVGKINVSVKDLNVDLLSFSAHKMYGPKGIGALFIKKGTNIKSIIPGSGQQNKMRGGTINVPAIVGFGKAAEIAIKNIIAYKNNLYLKEKLKAELIKLPGVFINGNENNLPNTLNLCFSKIDGQLLMKYITKIAVSNGSACNSAQELPSHVLMAMGLTEQQAMSSIRFSLGIHTNELEINTAIKHISDIYLSNLN